MEPTATEKKDDPSAQPGEVLMFLTHHRVPANKDATSYRPPIQTEASQ